MEVAPKGPGVNHPRGLTSGAHFNLLPLHHQVKHHDQATENSYYLISGGGYPQLLDELAAAVENIRDCKLYNYLVVCLDVEDADPAEKYKEVADTLAGFNPGLPPTTQSKIILQQRCIESWFLGNQVMFKHNPECKTLRGYIESYNVHDSCPEYLGRHEDFPTHAAYHLDYLKRIFKERGRVYSKTNPGDAMQEHFLRRLVERTENTEHLKTFAEFVSLCKTVRGYSIGYTATTVTF